MDSGCGRHEALGEKTSIGSSSSAKEKKRRRLKGKFELRIGARPDGCRRKPM